MAVGSDQRVGHGHRSGRVFAHENTLGEELQVYLMDDAQRGRHHPEVVQRLLTPAEELVTLAVPLEFQLDVHGQCVGRAVPIDLHRVVNDQVDRYQRVD